MRQLAFELYDDSCLTGAIQAIKEDQTEHNSFIVCHLFCGSGSGDDCLKVADALAKELPERSVIAGITSNAEFLNGRMTDQVLLLSVLSFDDSEAELVYGPDIEHNAKDFGRNIANRVMSSDAVKAVELLLCNPGVQILDIFKELETCDHRIQVFGCMPYAHDPFNDPLFVVVPGNVSYAGGIAIIYKGSDLYINVDYTSGWKAIGRNFKITKAEKCKIYEIDNRPGLDIYKKYLGMSEEDEFHNVSFEFPLIVNREGGDMLRHISGVNKDGSIDLDGYVEKGMIAKIAYGDPETIIDEINKRCAVVASFAPEAVLLYSCVARRLFWGALVNNEITPFNDIAPTCGLCTGGEISRDSFTGEIMWHNVTIVSAAFREGEKKRVVEAPKIDVNGITGQTLVVKRLMTLIRETSIELEELAIRDGLTGLYNRREINRIMDEVMSEPRLTSLIMVDIDHFKNVNDTFGHNAGDIVLRGVARELQKAPTGSDSLVGRWGGEEFFVVLPGVGGDAAVDIAESLRRNVAGLDFGETGSVTISLGVVEVSENIDWSKNAARIIKKVDEALYAAKAMGRNCVVRKEI